MKKLGFSLLFACLLNISDFASAQSLKDLLNSSTIKNAVTAVTGGQSVTISSIQGTWIYTGPAVQLVGDNALKNVAGSVATAEVEKKLETYCKKVGLEEGKFNFTFNTDSTFTSLYKGKTISGTYSLDESAKTILLQYGKLTSFNASVVLSDSEMQLLVNADKLLDFLGKLSSLSNSSTSQLISSMVNEYEGMKVGFDLKKQ